MARVKELPFEEPRLSYSVRLVGCDDQDGPLPRLHHISRGPSLAQCLMRSAAVLLSRVETSFQAGELPEGSAVIVRMEVTTWPAK